MKRIERILWIIALAGLVLRLLNLPMSGVLLILSMTLLGMFYLFLSVLAFPQPTRKDQVVIVSLLVGLVLGVALNGILFKIQLWPFSHFFLMVGGFWLAVLTLVVAYVRRKKPELDAYTRGLLKRMVPIMSASILFWLLPDTALVNLYYRDDPQLASLMERYMNTEDPAMREQLRTEMDALEEARFRGQQE
ncbi:MAG TPA: hypothetical protein PL070_07130 [Flavobacteriales bacterium]|nr:hypothetical protein [Flavobacteriales bacterium]